MMLHRLGFGNAGFHLGVEEHYLNMKNKSPNNVYLFLYENFDAVILGKTLKVEKEVYLAKPLPSIYRRSSGGGSVLHFKGNLNFGLLFSLEKFPGFYPIHDSYKKILGALLSSLKPWMPLEQKGLSDLSILQGGQYKKISGNSQVRRRGWVLHHGTLLYNTHKNIKISQFLRPPEKQPDYRENRSHKEFLMNALRPVSKSFLEKKIISSMAYLFGTSKIKTMPLPRRNIIRSIAPLKVKKYRDFS